MKRLSALTLSAFLLYALILCNCGGPGTTNLAPDSTRKTVETIPGWFLEPPTGEEYLFAPASATSRDLQLAVQKARTTAQADLAQQLGTRLANLTRQFQEETGLAEDSELLMQFSSATRAVSDETLVGARVDQQELVPEKGVYRAYVLMSLPIGTANQLLMDRIKADRNLYTRFRATRAFEDLNEELEAQAVREGN